MVNRMYWSKPMTLHGYRVIESGIDIATGRNKTVVSLQGLGIGEVLAVSTLYRGVFIRQAYFSAENLASPPKEIYCE